MTTTTVGTGKDHATWLAWEAATDNDLVTATAGEIGAGANEIHALSTTKLNISGATVDATYFRTMTMDTDVARYNHSSPTTGCRITSTSISQCIESADDYTKFIGIYMGGSGGTTESVQVLDIGSAGDNSLIDGCTIEYSGSSSGTTVACNITGAATGARIQNSLCIGGSRALVLGGSTVSAHNCIITGATGTDAIYDAANVVIKNCASFGNSATDDFRGSGTYTSCASEDLTADGTSPITEFTPSTEFSDVASDDYRIKGTSQFKSAGADNSALFTEDYIGDTWGTETSFFHIGILDKTDSPRDTGPMVDSTQRISNRRIRRM